MTQKAFLKRLLKRYERVKGVVVSHRERSHTPYKVFSFTKKAF